MNKALLILFSVFLSAAKATPPTLESRVAKLETDVVELQKTHPLVEAQAIVTRSSQIYHGSNNCEEIRPMSYYTASDLPVKIVKELACEPNFTLVYTIANHEFFVVKSANVIKLP